VDQEVVDAARKIARKIRVELKATPVHLDGRLEAFESELETSLSEIAPGTDEIGPNIDAHARILTGGHAHRAAEVKTH
jgi:hypothetical protein